MCCYLVDPGLTRVHTLMTILVGRINDKLGSYCAHWVKSIKFGTYVLLNILNPIKTGGIKKSNIFKMAAVSKWPPIFLESNPKTIVLNVEKCRFMSYCPLPCQKLETLYIYTCEHT